MSHPNLAGALTIVACLVAVSSPAVAQTCPEPVPYCSTSPNSAGAGARISWTGAPAPEADNFHLVATDCPANRTLLFFYGGTQISAPFGNGLRCVGGGVYRLRSTKTDANGMANYKVDYSTWPAGEGAGAWVPGTTWNCQAWFRDTAAGGSGFNLSDALSVQVCAGNGAQECPNLAYSGNGSPIGGITVPHDDSMIVTGDFTFELWVKPMSDLALGGTTPGKYHVVTKGWGVGLTTFGLGIIPAGAFPAHWTFGHEGPESNRFFQPHEGEVILGSWSHLAYVYTSNGTTGEIELFIDGVSIGSGPFDPAQTQFDGELAIGRLGSPSHVGRVFDGSIDELRLWRTARTQAEIVDNMHHSIPSYPELVYYYRFEDNGPPQVLDHGPNGLHGTLHAGIFDAADVPPGFVVNEPVDCGL